MTLPSIVAYAIHDSTIIAGTQSAGAFRSTDRGMSWQNVGFSSNNVAAFASSGRSLFASAAGSVFRTTNNGNSWNQVAEGLGDGATCIAANSTYLFAGTSVSGVWRRALSEIVVTVSQQEYEPASFALAQNYPNPFNSATTIKFTILVGTGHAPSLVKVYDVLGREVATLVNEVTPAGTYTVQWDAKELSSGVYFCRLQSGGLTSVRRLLLLR
ncbi:MAG: T9SS type A sorting domain-containing protein [Ignavibacteriae bacterium]|nr:T9SS type A sorting domain-containing protein [Ignavibacteriota bacterium]